MHDEKNRTGIRAATGVRAGRAGRHPPLAPLTCPSSDLGLRPLAPTVRPEQRRRPPADGAAPKRTRSAPVMEPSESQTYRVHRIVLTGGQYMPSEDPRSLLSLAGRRSVRSGNGASLVSGAFQPGERFTHVFPRRPRV